MSKESKSKGKQIDLQISLEDLKEIVAGRKIEDFRTMSRYNLNVLSTSDDKWEITPRTDIARVRFVSGFKNIKFAICEINGIFIDEFKKFVPKGIKPGSMAFSIEIRQVVEHNL